MSIDTNSVGLATKVRITYAENKAKITMRIIPVHVSCPFLPISAHMQQFTAVLLQNVHYQDQAAACQCC